MNRESLLFYFNRISDAPDAIPRLRQFVLELAVRGKLVDRDPKDEPASALLNRIQAEKDRRVKDGRLKKQGCLPEVRPDETWFQIPASWHWVRLGTITQVLMGQSPPGESYNKTGEGIPLINGPVEFTEGPFGKTFINQYTTDPTNLCQEGDLLLCVRGSTTGRTNIAGFRACIGRGVAAIRPFFADQYVRLFIWRQRASIIAMGRGVAFPSVSRQQIEELPVPLPPLAEQQRIVAKVDELMALCDRLEAEQRERETRRGRLASASLYHLNNGTNVEALRGYARFYLDHLPQLVIRSGQLLELRQTILDLAVRGRLVPQELTDEPAAELLKRIQVEIARMVRAGEAKEQKSFEEGRSATEPFDIPRTWVWVSLGQVAFGFRYGTSVKCSYERTGEPVLRIPNIDNGRINIDDLKFGPLPRREADDLRLQVGDILMVRSNGSLNLVGRPAVVEAHAVGFCYAGYLVRVRTSTTHLNAVIYCWPSAPLTFGTR